MAERGKSVAENVSGDFFVDTTCIDCGECRQLAPLTFGDANGYSFVQLQPRPGDDRAALRALLACPTASIGCEQPARARAALGDFPLELAAGVYYCGFNSPKSYGGSSYFLRDVVGNWLIDSPRFNEPLARALERLGGVQHIFLTHRDDVADAALWARRFGAERIIHRAELNSQPGAERVIDGDTPVALAPELLAIPTPGHTRGHLVLLAHERFLFSGDHLWWNTDEQRLGASRSYCWYSWPQQVESMQRLAQYGFEWVLPGHGDRVHLPADEMRSAMQALLARMGRANKKSSA